MSHSKAKVLDALSEIRKVFGKYKVTHPVEGSPISISPEMQHNLEHDTYNTLPRYFFHSMTTWGTENEFKAFLPTILDMYVFDVGHFWTSDMLFRKLKYAKFETWDQQEQDVIHAYCKALWDYLLDNYEYPNSMIAREFIKNVFQPEYYLGIWEARLDEVDAVRHLAEFVNFYYPTRSQRKIKPIVSKIHDQWVITQKMQNYLEVAYFQYMDEAFSEEISHAVECLKWQLWRNQDSEI